MKTPFRHVAEALLIGAAGGLLFNWLGFPAGLISGAVLAVATAAIAGRPLAIPVPLGRVILVLAGITLGSVVTPEMLRGIAAYPASIAVLSLATVAIMAGTAVYLRLFHRWDPLSALFGASPGALAQVTALSIEAGGDIRAILIVQTVRVVGLTAGLPLALALLGLATSAAPGISARPVPPLGDLALLVATSVAGSLLLHKLRFPGGWMFGAMMGSAALHGSGFIRGGLPFWIVASAMISLGAINGSRFANTGVRVLLRYSGAALGSFAVGMAVSLIFIALAATLAPVPPADLVIAYAPGAQDTMMVLALALGLDPVFVGAHHLTRFLICSIAVPIAARFLVPPPRR